jgi:predicted adenylyl cyclase CyaB
MREIEIKIRLKDSQSLKKKVLKLGGRIIEKLKERDTYFDNGRLSGRGEILRLRKLEGKSLLTFKGKAKKNTKLLDREELESYFDDPQTVSLILNKLGFEPIAILEKKISNFSFRGLTLEFHEVAFLGDFLEIEASEKKLKKVLPRLGLSINDAVGAGYLKLFSDFGKKHGISLLKSMTFEAEKQYLQKTKTF